MKRIDRLILKEMFGPWVFGVAIFTVLIMAGSFLFELTRYASGGISGTLVLQLILLILPGIMAKTFPMAVLLAALLSFGRLSSDSEIVALKAGGISVERMMRPVFLFGIGVFGLTMFFNETLVPQASLQALRLRTEINQVLDQLGEQPRSFPIVEDGQIRGLVSARSFSFTARTLEEVVVAGYGEDGEVNAVLIAPELFYSSEDDWRLRRGGLLIDPASLTLLRFVDEVIPESVPDPGASPEEIELMNLRELDALSMREMRRQIDVATERQAPREEVANLEFGYWNKIAIPLAAIIFGLVGAPLGIRSHRTGAATGFSLSVLIIFGYMMTANMMSIYAQNGVVPAFLASFAPIILGAIVALVFIRRRNI